MSWLLMEQPRVQLVPDRSSPQSSKPEVSSRAGDLLLLRVVLEPIETEDQVDRLLRDRRRISCCSWSSCRVIPLEGGDHLDHSHDVAVELASISSRKSAMYSSYSVTAHRQRYTVQAMGAKPGQFFALLRQSYEEKPASCSGGFRRFGDAPTSVPADGQPLVPSSPRELHPVATAPTPPETVAEQVGADPVLPPVGGCAQRLRCRRASRMLCAVRSPAAAKFRDFAACRSARGLQKQRA